MRDYKNYGDKEFLKIKIETLVFTAITGNLNAMKIKQ